MTPEEAIRDYAGFVQRVAARTAGRDAADDICQAVFLLLLKKGKAIIDRPNLGGWLYRTTVFVALNHRKKQSRRTGKLEEAAQMAEKRRREAGPDAEALAHLDEALAGLPAKYREPLVLCYVAGRSQNDAAQELGVAPGTLRQRLSRGIDRLRTRLGRKGYAVPATALAGMLAVEMTPPAALVAQLTAVAAATQAPAGAAAAIAQSAATAMTVAKIKIATVVLCAATVVVGGGGAAAKYGIPGLRPYRDPTSPDNNWIKLDVSFPAPPRITDARWTANSAGRTRYDDALYRPDAGTLLWPTRIDSRKLKLRPVSYNNVLLEWKPGSPAARAFSVFDKWGGGSKGRARLHSGFAESPQPAPRQFYEGWTYVPEKKALYVMLGAFSRMQPGAAPDALAQLKRDEASTWQYSFETGRWRRIDDSVRRIWPNRSTVSSYFSFLQHSPGSGNIFFIGSNARRHAVFDIETEKWTEKKLANKPPFAIGRGGSAWDSKRGLLIIRDGEKLCSFDPRTSAFSPLPDIHSPGEPDSGASGLAYDAKNDVYVANGPTGHKTWIHHPVSGKSESVYSGELKLPNGYLEYDPASDRVIMVYHRSAHAFRYAPKKL